MATTVSQRVLVPMLVYGTTSYFILKNSDGISEYFSEISRATIHFLTRPHNIHSLSNAGSTSGTPIDPQLNSKLDAIAKALASSSSSAPLVAKTTIFYGLAGLVVTTVSVYAAGSSLNDIMYVTKRNFRTTTEVLKEGVQNVASALIRVRGEVLERLGIVERKLDETRAELVQHVSAEAGAIRGEVAKMDARLEGIEISLGKANRGISLLCHVVLDQFYPGGGAKDGKINNNERHAALLKELSLYTQLTDVPGSTNLFFPPPAPTKSLVSPPLQPSAGTAPTEGETETQRRMLRMIFGEQASKAFPVPTTTVNRAESASNNLLTGAMNATVMDPDHSAGVKTNNDDYARLFSTREVA